MRRYIFVVIDMEIYLLKWGIASLITPLFVFVFQSVASSLTALIIILWPGSIMLMALGADKKPISEVVYVWSLSVGSNVLLYVVIGLILFYFTKSNAT